METSDVYLTSRRKMLLPGRGGADLQRAGTQRSPLQKQSAA